MTVSNELWLITPQAGMDLSVARHPFGEVVYTPANKVDLP